MMAEVIIILMILANDWIVIVKKTKNATLSLRNTIGHFFYKRLSSL